MKYALIVDSVGCIPEQEYRTRPLELLPLSVSFDDVQYLDTFAEKSLLPIHAAGRIGVKSNSMSITPSADDVRKYLMKNIVLKYDVAIFQTAGQAYTPIYLSCRAVSDSVAADAKALRLKENITTPFRMTSTETKTALAGQGLIAIYSDDLLQGGMSLTEFTPLVERFKSQVKSFLVVRDAMYARHRQKLKGNKTVSLPVAIIANALEVSPITLLQDGELTMLDVRTRGADNAIEKVLEYCVARVSEGLLAPLVNVSVAGDPAILTNHSSFKRLENACAGAGIRLYVSVMTLAASIQIGPGAISVGIAPVNQTNTL